MTPKPPSSPKTAKSTASSIPGKVAKKAGTPRHSVSIAPGISILKLFPRMNYKIWYALAELVDNSIDSYIVNKKQLIESEGSDYQLRIVIKYDSLDGILSIWDNASGINSANYERAFETANPPIDAAGLSQYGIGMKSASCWFARQWRVTTTALGEDELRTIHFDVPKITDQGITSLEPDVRPDIAGSHWTEIRLWDLYNPPHPQTLAKVKRHLISMYRVFIRSGELELTFNGEILSFDEVDVMVQPPFDNPSAPALTWKKPVSFALSNGQRVRGFVAIREKGNASHAGFAMFRLNRLIVGSSDDAFRPSEIFGRPNSFRYQRLFGEIHLDDTEVATTKDLFIWDNNEDEFLEKLKDAIVDGDLSLIKQAEGFRATNADEGDIAIATTAIAKTAEQILKAKQIIEDQATEQQPVTSVPTEPITAKIDTQKMMDFIISGKTWEIAVDLTTDPAVTDWLTISDRPRIVGKAPRRLEIQVSLSHPFTVRYKGNDSESLEGLIRLAVGVAIAEITARESGVSGAGRVRNNLNELLYHVLSKK